MPRMSAGPRFVWTAVLIAISILPDIDLVLPTFGISDAVTLGHRGATHSLLFALIICGIVTSIAAVTQFPPRRAAIGAMLAIGTHWLLDTLSPGPGVALFWPFSTLRLPTFPILPIAPHDHLFSARGLTLLLAETLVFVPFLVYALIPRPAEGKKQT